MRFQDYDYRILGLLDDYRFLDTQMVWHLVKLYHPELTFDTLKHRLHALWRNAYIDRPPQQLSLLVMEDDFHLIMCLTEQGARLVSKHYGRDWQRTSWRAKQDKASYRLLEHQLAISRFRAAIQLSRAFTIPLWLHDRQFTKKVTFPIKTEKQLRLLNTVYRQRTGQEPVVGVQVTQMVQPDSFFILDGKNGSQIYALEIDRGSQTVATMARKYLTYYKMMKRLQQEPIRVDGHQIGQLRVLTVSPDETRFEKPGVRMRHFQEAVRTLDEKGKGPRSFWFTTEDQFSWTKPDSILKPIWQTPRQEELLSLLD